MPQRWNKLLLSALAISALWSACKKPTSSSDDPLPTNYYPSIIINSDNEVVVAVDPGTGKKNWELRLPYAASNTLTDAAQFTPSPLLYNGRVYLATGRDAGTAHNDTLYKVNSLTGQIVKRVKVTPSGTNDYIFATPVADANLVYVATNGGNLYALDTGTLAVKWSFTASDGGAFVASPAIGNGRIYAATLTGHVYAIDKTSGPDGSGNPKWDWPGLGVTVPLPASFISSPAVDTHYVFIGSITDSNMYCIYVNPTVTGSVPEVGQVRWTYKTKGAIVSSPTAYKGTCIFGCNDFRLYCLDTFIAPNAPVAPYSVPRARWIDSAHSEIYSSPVAVGNTVYFASKDYRLYCANIINGSIRWFFQTNGLIKSSPLQYKDKVYIASYDKNLYAVDTGSGTVKWTYNVGGQMSCSPIIDDLSGKSYNTGISGLVN
jgi:outer membrane protein assembly factor BamB